MKSSRGDGLGNEKKSKRYAPYGDKESFRTYKPIVPAPPRAGLDIKTPLVQSPDSLPPRSPKRKRDASAEQQFYPERREPVAWSDEVETPRQPMPSSFPQMPFRSALSSRIPIESLLTFDQAAIAAFVSQQSLNTYTPNYYRDSPLTDPVLFEAFRHYVEVVGPTMSLIESSPPNPTILNHHVVPNLKACNLFTYQL